MTKERSVTESGMSKLYKSVGERIVGERVEEARAAMAEKFGVPGDDFCVVVDVSEAERKAVLVYAAPNGLHKGSWHEIYSESDDSFTIKVGDEVHDTRKGMTWAVYKAMVIVPGVGRQIDASSNQIKTDTWLTGEGVGQTGIGGEMPFLASNDFGNSPELFMGYAKSEWENGNEIRTFRPSIIVYSVPK